MPYKNPEIRNAHNRKKYAYKKSLGWKRIWGTIEAICPICNKSRILSKNSIGIKELSKNEENKFIKRCRSCSKRKDYAPWFDKKFIHDYQVRKRRKLKVRAIKYLGEKCMNCGYDYNGKNAFAFDFHHRNALEREFSIGRKCVSWVKMLIELKKCDLLCAICHRGKHSAEY